MIGCFFAMSKFQLFPQAFRSTALVLADVNHVRPKLGPHLQQAARCHRPPLPCLFCSRPERAWRDLAGGGDLAGEGDLRGGRGFRPVPVVRFLVSPGKSALRFLQVAREVQLVPSHTGQLTSGRVFFFPFLVCVGCIGAGIHRAQCLS